MKIYCFFILLLISACSGTHYIYENKNGTYKYGIVKGSQVAMPVVIGEIYDYETKKPLRTTGFIKIKNAVMCKTDKNGEFVFSLQPGVYRIAAIGIPFEPCETKKIKISNGDSLKLYFHLKPDTTTMID